MVTAALDIERAEVLDAREARRIDHGCLAHGRVGRAGLRHLEQHAAQRVVDLLVVAVLALRAQAGEERAEPASRLK